MDVERLKHIRYCIDPAYKMNDPNPALVVICQVLDAIIDEQPPLSAELEKAIRLLASIQQKTGRE